MIARKEETVIECFHSPQVKIDNRSPKLLTLGDLNASLADVALQAATRELFLFGSNYRSEWKNGILLNVFIKSVKRWLVY